MLWQIVFTVVLVVVVSVIIPIVTWVLRTINRLAVDLLNSRLHKVGHK